MADLKSTFFENPLYVYVMLAFAELVVAAIWYEKRRPAWAVALLAAPLLAGAVALVERAVVTDREKIVAAAREIAQDIEAGSVAAAEKYLDEQFSGRWANKRLAVAAGETAIKKYQINSVKLKNMRVEVSPPSARMHAVTRVEITGSGAAGWTMLVWDVRWIKRPDGWRIIEVISVRQGIGF